MTQENQNQNGVTSVSDYRNKLSEVKRVKLPSGSIFEIRRLSPMDYIREGLADLPNEFFKFIGEVVNSKLPEAETPEGKKNYELFEKFLKVSVEKGIVNPPVTLKYEKDKAETHLIFGELTLEDQTYIVQIITGRLDPIVI